MSEKYLGENSTPLLINQIKENCTQKRSTLPTASIDELGNTYQYTSTTSGSLVHGYFYECVSDGQDPATYSWQNVNVQPTAGTPTASGTTFDNTTSGLQATNVQDAIDEVEGRVDTAESDISNIEEKIPSTATSTNKLVDHDSLGTAAFKDSTDRVSPNNTALVESQSVYSAINTALSSIYTPRGDITCAELTSSLLIAANVGNVYETSDSGTTTALFLQGAGVPIATGDNVGIINAGEGRILFNLMANAFDLTDYQKKDLASTIEGATTVEGTLSALSTDKQAKDLATTVESATTVEGALGALSTNKQAKTLTTSVESQTTVEGALGALSTNKATQAEVNDIVNVLGAKNLLPFNFSHIRKINGGGTWNNNVYTYKDITYTVNADGTITVNGTATDYSLFRIIDANSIFLNPSNNYYITGSPSSSTASTYYVYYSELINGSWVYYSNLGNENTLFTPNASATQFVVDVVVRSGVTVNNLVFQPMIRLASDPDNTYVPYAMTNQQITPYVQAISNPNLLDNPWFTVNQRGITNDWTTQFAYGVDRWRKQTSVNNTLQITDNGISATTSSVIGIYQVFKQADVKDLYGRILTFSVMYGDGTIESGSGLLPLDHYLPSSTKQKQFISNTTKCNYVQTESYSNGNLNIVVNTKAGTTIKAVKLELGSVSTLAMDTAPNYATELMKCQRYFVRYSASSNYVTLALGTEYNSKINAPLYLPCEMRTSPTISFSGSIKTYYTADNTKNSNVSALTNAGMVGNCIKLNATYPTSLGNGAVAEIQLNSGAYIDLSADL